MPTIPFKVSTVERRALSAAARAARKRSLQAYIRAMVFGGDDYGLTPAEMQRAGARIAARVRAAKTVPYTPGMLTRAHRTDQAISRRAK